MRSIGRLLIMGKNCASTNMAIDEALMIQQFENPNPTLRFYDWSSPAFSFGYFQNISSEVHVDTCISNGIEVVKRMTGGGTVVHGWDLTYSLILPRQNKELPISDVYRTIGSNLVTAFHTLNIPAECNTTRINNTSLSQNICLTNSVENDVIYGEKKIAGVSVRRNRNGFMFQGYISLNKPPDNILRSVSKDPETQKLLVEKPSAINLDERFIARDSLINAIIDAFNIGIDFKIGILSKQEEKFAQDLSNSKYVTNAWNFSM